LFVAVRDGIVTWAGFQELFSALASLGLGSFELAVSRKETTEPSTRISLATPLGFDLSMDADTGRLRDALRGRGLSLCALLVDNDFARQDLEAEVQYVVKACEAAYELGVKAVRINAVMRETPGSSLLDYHRRALKGIRACLEQTEGLGVALAIENHGVIGNRHGFLFRLLEEARSDLVGLTLDTGNFYWYGYPLEEIYDIVYGFAPYVKHTHIKNGAVPADRRDRKRKPRDMVMAPLYEGDIELRTVVETLRDAGYDHDLTVEDESLGRFPAEERKQVLSRDIEHMKSLLRTSPAQGD